MTTQNPAKQMAQKEREERLAAELRENLRKRKAQSRARRSDDGEQKTPDK